MAGNWNPNQPAALGLEWLVSRTNEVRVARTGVVIAMRLRSTVAETVTGLRLRAAGSPQVDDPLFTIIDVYPAGAAASYPGSTARTVVQLPPNADYNRGTWVTSAGGTTNLWQHIDDPTVYPPVGNDWIRQSTAGSSAYRCFINDAALPANARVLRVVVGAIIGAQPNPTITTRQFAFRLEHIPTAQTFTPPGASFQATIYGNRAIVDFGEVNPVTLMPWTRADIAEFNGGAWAVRVEAVGDPQAWARMDSLCLSIDYLPAENRVAVATWPRPAGPVPEWVASAGLRSMPSGAAGWAKPGSGDWDFVWRVAHAPLLTGAGPLADDVRWLACVSDLTMPGVPQAVGQGLVYPPPPGMAAREVIVDGYGLGRLGAGPDGVAGYGLVLTKAGPAYSDDSQPYGVTPALTVTAASGPASQRVRQTSGSTQSYLGARFVAYPPESPAHAGSVLTVSVHLVSSGAQVGGSASWTAAEARAVPALTSAPSWRLLAKFLSSAAALANNTQYEIRFTVTGPGAWLLSAPDQSVAGAAGYRGTVDSARLGGSTMPTRDVSAVLLIQPSPPTSAAATAVDVAVGQASGCGPDTIQRNRLTWVKTNLGGAFSHYEVERLDQDNSGADVWNLIANIATEATQSFDDAEAALNRPTRYRIRAITTTQAFSAWALTGLVTPEHLDARGDPHPSVVFTSNAEPGLTVVYDHDPTVPFEFLDHEADEVMRPYGADGSIVFFEPEDRGVSVRYRLTVNFGTAPVVDGLQIGDEAVFAPLRRITRSTAIPYVCVLDGFGNRRYAHVMLGNGEREMPQHGYWANADVIPVQFLPTVVGG